MSNSNIAMWVFFGLIVLFLGWNMRSRQPIVIRETRYRSPGWGGRGRYYDPYYQPLAGHHFPSHSNYYYHHHHHDDETSTETSTETSEENSSTEP